MHALATPLGSLAAIILVSHLLAEVARRRGHPTLVGALGAGALLGPSVAGLVDPHDAVLEAVAALGALVLLFEIGLHTDIRALRRVGKDVVAVAAIGAVAPFAGGYAVAWAFGLRPVASFVIGAALTATSIGIAARALRDVERLDTPEGQAVRGAAGLDNLLALVMLGAVASIAAGASPTAAGVALHAGLAVGFTLVAIAVGAAGAPPIARLVDQVRARGALGLVALAFALLLGVAAEASGSTMVVGALAAGLVLHSTPQRAEIERGVTRLGHFFVPVFFAVVGATAELGALADGRVLAAGAALTVIGILGKLATGFAFRDPEGNRMVVAVAMIPRGELGLIVAQVAAASGAIGAGEFGATLLMVIVTTLITPPWLRAVTNVRRQGAPGVAGEGLDDLVAGSRPMTPRATQPVKRNY